MIACLPSLHYIQVMSKLWIAVICCLLALAGASPFSASANEAEFAKIAWNSVAPGLELAELAHGAPDTVLVTVLRIDPTLYEFGLYSVLWDSPQQLTSAEWAEKFNLSATINAGMFLPDGRPTAYVRRGDQSPKRQVAANYGSFFISGPRKKGLPSCAVLDKNRDDWETLLPQYDVVVQNMRLLGAEGEQLWPENGPQHAIAAIAQDTQGRILFLHCRSQVNVHRLVQALLAYPSLGLAQAMYVEGGSQSSLSLRTPDLQRTWTGVSSTELLLGTTIHFPLPTVIGIRPRQDFR